MSTIACKKDIPEITKEVEKYVDRDSASIIMDMVNKAAESEFRMAAYHWYRYRQCISRIKNWMIIEVSTEIHFVQQIKEIHWMGNDHKVRFGTVEMPTAYIERISYCHDCGGRHAPGEFDDF